MTKEISELRPIKSTPTDELDTTLEAAKSYLQKGFAVVPVKSLGKRPIQNEWQNMRLSEDELPNYFSDQTINIGLILGAASDGLVDIDIDDDLALKVANEILPETGMISGRKTNPQSHYFYKVDNPGQSQKFADPVSGTMLIEYRANGAQTVVPPSTHESKEKIIFYSEGTPVSITRDDLIAKVRYLAAATALAKHWPTGNRHNAVLALAGGLHRSAWSMERIEQFIGLVCTIAEDEEQAARLTDVRTTVENLENGKHCTGWPALTETLGEKLVQKVREWLGVQAEILPVTSQEISHSGYVWSKSDADNAAIFANKYADKLRYNFDSHKWIIWNGSFWEEDSTNQVLKLAEWVGRSLLQSLDQYPDSKEREDAFRAAQVALNARGLEAILRLAKSRLAIRQEQLDTHPWLLNCSNGTVDLKSGKLLRHTPQDFITKSLKASYKEESECPQFRKFLADIFNSDSDLIKFVQRIFGMCLTGDTSEQVFFVFHGSGANGKSTLINVMRELLSPFARTLPMKSLVKRNSDSTNDIAMLDGARFVHASEGERTQKLDEALIKQMSGDDPISAKFLYKEYFEFIPQFKLFICTNHRPELTSDDPAIWRRVILVPFNVTIPAEERDKHLLSKLKQELPSILRWAVEGCLDWQQNGFNPPSAVQSATSDYQDNMDIVKRFISECCITEDQATVTPADLNQEFEDWCKGEKIFNFPRKKLKGRLEELGYRQRRKANGRFWHGLRLDTGLSDDLKDKAA